MTFADQIIRFNQTLDFKGQLPTGIRVMNPFKENHEIDITASQFYKKYYDDHKKRYLILGINPGRFGAGATGVPFTDTKRMKEKCGIEIKDFESHETSSVFVYDVIEEYGGVEKFYSDFYINSVCPLGFTAIGKNGKEVNFNYYDSKELTHAAYSFIIDNLKKQMEFPLYNNICFCLGTGKNYDFLLKLNAEFCFFKRIIPLDHPRFIMQYRTKQKNLYITKYIEQLSIK